MYHMFYGNNPVLSFLSMILPMLLWVLIIIGIIYLVFRWFGRHNQNLVDEPGENSPLDTLKKRYAAGEISRGEYLSMKKDVQED